ncbi:MAG: hypothetical protein OER80_12250 [Gammaproteobacteria bacterium]|nr:hypothetical protein [Gammaproteobacteria bacterium]MDH3768442.1 hypothetical protein [Gammaproteobacteria bacterium]
MKIITLVAGTMMAIQLAGCATHDAMYMTRGDSTSKRAECTYTKRIAGQRCQVIQSEEDIRRLMREMSRL